MTEKITNAEIYRVVVRIDERTAKLEKAIFTGNGSPPVLSRVSTLEERTKTLGRLVAGLVGAALGISIGPKP